MYTYIVTYLDGDGTEYKKVVDAKDFSGAEKEVQVSVESFGAEIIKIEKEL